MTVWRRMAVGLSLLATVLVAPRRGSAFTHVVKPGETLSQIASRVYGDAKRETILAGANALDAQGGSAIVPGMHLEIPAPGHHTATSGDTWASLASTWLGDARRADVLATLNHAVAWIDPPAGLAVEIPAIVAHIAADGETSASLAARYWGDANRGWELNAFNQRREAPLARGEILLVWLSGLVLTDAGKAEALSALKQMGTEVETARLEVQRHADAELPLLSEDVEQGRYVEGVARGNRVIASGPLTRPQLACAYRALVEAYVALGAAREASAACASWRANDPSVRIDPDLTSPKIRAACAR